MADPEVASGAPPPPSGGEQTTSRGPSELTPLKEGKSSWHVLDVLGPGLLVCLADTDAGSLIVAAQSGARWGYSLLPLNVILIPILFMAQELTVRLGVHTKLGHTACIKKHFGNFWAWSACILLVIECVFAMMSEMSGIAATGELWGLDRTVATLVSSAAIMLVVFFCNYRQVEVIGIVLGLFELTFVVTMFAYHPDVLEVLRGCVTLHSNPDFISMIAANIGSVIMPWMIYFQQSAVVARRLTTHSDLQNERAHTLFGSVLTQLVMIAALVTLAAAHPKGENLQNVRDIVTSLTPVLGFQASRVLISIAFLGASLCAAFVESLAAAWAVCEALGYDDQFSVDDPPTKAPHFYGCFVGVVVVGAVVLVSGVNIVQLNVFVELLDGLLLPFAVGFLYFLACGDALPPEDRVTGAYKYILGVVFALCSLVSLASAIYGLAA